MVSVNGCHLIDPGSRPTAGQKLFTVKSLKKKQIDKVYNKINSESNEANLKLNLK